MQSNSSQVNPRLPYGCSTRAYFDHNGDEAACDRERARESQAFKNQLARNQLRDLCILKQQEPLSPYSEWFHSEASSGENARLRSDLESWKRETSNLKAQFRQHQQDTAEAFRHVAGDEI